MPEEKKLEKNLFNFIRQPSILGGPSVFDDIIIKNKLKDRYVKYIRKNKNIPVIPYYDKDNNTYLFHFRIVSDSKEDVFYDVVIQLSTKNSKFINESHIVNYDNIKVFSNTPGFTFTYAYAYNKYGLLVPSLVDKFDGNILEEKPQKTNPRVGIGFDYSIFMCIYFLQINKFYLRKADIQRRGKHIREFNPDDVANCYEALRSRNRDKVTIFKRVKDETTRAVKNATRPVRNLVSKFVPNVLKSTPTTKTANRTKRGVKTVKKATTSPIVRRKK